MAEVSVIARRVLEGHRRRNPRPARRKAIELKDFLEGQHPRDYRGRFRRKIGPIPMATRNWLGRAMRKSKVRRRDMPPTPLALMVCTGQPDMDRYAAPGMARLLVPDMHDAARATEADGVPFACDNGGFFGVDEKKFKDMCEQMAAQHVHPLWVTAPDVLIHQPDGSVRGDARATVRRFEEWEQYLHHLGLPAALVAQDDMDEPDMLEWLDSHWDKVDAIFIGGSDDFKLGPGAAKITKLAQEHGKLVHMGRVNTAMRLVYARDMLGVDSVDGQNWNKFKDQKLPGGLTFIPSGEGPPTTMGKRWLDAVWKAIETGSPWPRPPRPNAKLADFLDSNGNWRLFFDRPGPTPALAKALAPQPVIYFAPLSDLMYECGLSDQAQLHFTPGKAGFSVDFVERWQLDSFVRLMQLPEPRVDGRRASWPDVLVRPGDADEYAAEEKALGVDWGELGEWVETGAAVPALLGEKAMEKAVWREELHPRDAHGHFVRVGVHVQAALDEINRLWEPVRRHPRARFPPVRRLTMHKRLQSVGSSVVAAVDEEVAHRTGDLARRRRELEARSVELDNRYWQLSKERDKFFLKFNDPEPTPEWRAARDQVVSEINTISAQETENQKERRQLQADEADVRQHALLDVLAQIRPMGGELDVSPTPAQKPEHEGEPWFGPGQPDQAKITEAQQLLPADWIKAMNDAGPMRFESEDGVRAHFTTKHDMVTPEGWSGSTEGVSWRDMPTVVIAPSSGADVYLHELVHRLQHVDGTDAPRHLAQFDFLLSRTGPTQADALEKVEPLKEISPFGGYSPGEVAVGDDFPDPYYGKMYGSDYLTSDSNELLTMALQDLFYRPDRIAKDKGTYEWILGVLATL